MGRKDGREGIDQIKDQYIKYIYLTKKNLTNDRRYECVFVCGKKAATAVTVTVVELVDLESLPTFIARDCLSLSMHMYVYVLLFFCNYMYKLLCVFNVVDFFFFKLCTEQSRARVHTVRSTVHV